MTNITNKHNLPQTLMNLALRDTYSRGNANISVTQLIGSPKIRVLQSEHRDKMTSDVSEQLWSLLGRAVHSIVEQGADDEHLAEERLYTKVNGWTLSGGIDLQILGTSADGTRQVALSDYKVTSAWAVMNPKPDWERQLNCYAYLIEQSKGWEVTGLTINAIVRDWTRHEAARREGYPAVPMVVLPQTLWTPKAREEYVLDRMKVHQDAERAFDWNEPMPECTDEERWYRPGKVAVIKEGRVRALKVFDMADLEQAEAFAAENKAKVELRPGENTRCENFCPVSQWCDQYKGYQESK